MDESQKYIYYATGETVDKIAKLPQLEIFADKNYEVLFFTDEVDEFAIKMLRSYKDKEFKSISSGDLELEEDKITEDTTPETEEFKDIFEFVTKTLEGKITSAKASKRLKTHPVCLSSTGELSIEMEKVLNMMPESGDVKAEKVLEINTSHNIFEILKTGFISSATNEHKENFSGNVDMFYFNKILNDAWLSNSFDSIHSLPNDIKEEDVIDVLNASKQNTSLIQNWINWRNYFKQKYIAIGCEIDY